MNLHESSAELPNNDASAISRWLLAVGVSLGTALLVIAPFSGWERFRT